MRFQISSYNAFIEFTTDHGQTGATGFYLTWESVDPPPIPDGKYIFVIFLPTKIFGFSIC